MESYLQLDGARFTFFGNGSLNPLSRGSSIEIVVTLLSLLSIVRLTEEIDDKFFSLSTSSKPFPLFSREESTWNGFFARMGKEIFTDLSFASIFSLVLNELRNGFVETLIVGDVTVEVVIIVVVIMSSANGLLLIVVLVLVVSGFGDFCPFSTLDPLVTGTLIFSTTPPWMSEKCVTVTLSFLFVFFSMGVGISGIIEGRLQTFGVVGDVARWLDAGCAPPFKFNVNLSPPCCTIYTQIDGRKNDKKHTNGERNEMITIRDVKRHNRKTRSSTHTTNLHSWWKKFPIQLTTATKVAEAFRESSNSWFVSFWWCAFVWNSSSARAGNDVNKISHACWWEILAAYLWECCTSSGWAVEQRSS